MADTSFFSDESLYPNSMITGEDMSTNMGNIGQTAFTINASKSGGDNVDTLVQFSDKASQGKHTLGAYRLADNTKLPLDFTVDNLSERTRNAIINNPTYASYYWENPLEWNALDAMIRANEDFRRKREAEAQRLREQEGNPSISEYIRNNVPDWQLTEYERQAKATSQELKEQERFNAIAGILNHKFPNWRKESDDDVRVSLRAIENVFGVSTNGISIERLRETKGVEWERALNLFGAVDIYKAHERLMQSIRYPELSPENLTNVDENSPLHLQEAKLRQLQEEELSMRNSTWGEDVLNSVISSVPLMTEMWITGGLSNVSNLVKAGWSAAIKEGGKKGAMKYALNVMKEATASGLRRIPAYIPQSAAEAYNYNYASRLVTFIDGDGNIAVEATDEKVSNFVEGMLSYIVQHYTEVTSEELGGLIPDFDAKFASWLMRRSVRNSVVSKLINNPVTRNIAEKSLRSVIPFDGIVGEFAEEEVGNLMQYFATSLMELANFDEQNTPGVQKPLLSLRDTGTTLASIALQGPLFRASTAGLRRAFHPAGTYGAIRNTYRARKQVENFQDSVKVFRETKVAKTGNINEAERALYMHTEGDALMNVDREDAKGILYQLTNLNDNTKDEADSNREALQDIGISDGTIKVAEERGSDVIVSRNRLLALASSPKFKNAMAIGEAVINEVASMEFGKRVKDITPDTFIEGKIDELIDKARDAQKLTDEVERRMLASANTAYKNAEDQWKADPKNEGKAFPGISKSAINSFSSVFSVFSRYLSNEVQDKQVVMDLVKGLSIEFIRDPESFDAKEAVRKLREASGMKTSDRVVAAQKKVDESRVKIANLEERISDYEKYPGMSEQDEEKYQVLQDELYEEKENLADREKELEQAKKEEPSPLMQLIGKKGMANLADAARFSRKLALAKRMKKSGRTSDAIWLATGWHLGADKKWRMEIPYLKLKNKMPEKGSASAFDVIMSYFDGLEDGKLSDFVDAPELFQAYPKLKDIDVKFEVLDPNLKGGLTGNTLYINTLYYAPRALHDALSADTIDLAKVTRMANSLYDLQTEMRMTIVHEVQHAIQEIEGFAKGTTTDRAGLMPDEIDPKYVRLKGELDKAEKAWHKAMIAYRDHLKKNGITNEKFQNVPYDFPNAGSANRIISSLKESPYAVDKKTVKLLEKMVETNAEYQAAWDATKASRDVFDRYFRYAGEVESRNASLRSLLLDDDLMALAPDETEMELDDPVAREDQIVLFQIATEYQKEMLNEAVRQAYDSGETSRPQVAAAFKKINFKEGTTNLDLGGGKYDFATDYLVSKGVENLVYDPVNRNSETNNAIFNVVQSGGVDTVTCNNVLNVIKEAEIRSNVILQAAKALRAGGTAYFSVYVGDKSGVGRATQNNQSWQNNRPTKDYMDEIRQHFSDVTVKNDVITARGPIVDNKTSAWFNDGFDAPPVYYQAETEQKGTVQGLMIARFSEMQNSLITLFQSANASTLPHESAHWLRLAMEYLVESGYASDKMVEDLRTINEWLDKQDYSEKSAKEQGIRFFKDGSFDVGQMREEYFARAFEAYLTTGKFPERATNALKTALRNLTKLLQAIYRNAQSLNVKMDESITQFFDGLFAVDSVVEETGVLSAILREINEESLSMTKQQIDDLKKAIQKQQDVAEAEAWHAAVVAYQQGIREQIPIWRNNANISYEDSRAEKAFVYVKGAGHKLYEGFLRDTLKLPEDTIANLRAKGLTVKNPYRADMTPANTTAETAAPPQEESSKTNETATEEELKNTSELDGSFEQFDALPDNAVITIPKGQACDDILAVLSYDQVNDDETVTQSPIERRVHTQSDILRKEGSTEINSVIYNAAVKYFAKTGVHTKGGLLKFVSSAVSNANINKANKNGRFILAPNTTETDENGNLRPGMENQATEDNLAVLDKEMVLAGIKAVVDELGQQKTEDGNNTVDYAIAQIVYELAASDSIPSVKDSEILKAIRAEYRERSKSRTQEEGYKAGHSLLDKASRRTWKLIKERVSGSLRQTAPSSAALGNSARTIADAVEKFGYASPIELINELLSAKGRRDFIRDYIAARKEEYREAFLNTPEWNSETGAVRVLDAILRSLNMIPPGEKFAERAKVALEDAKNDMMENMTVGEILSVLNDNTLQTSLRSNMSQILKAIKAKESDRMKLVQVVLNMQKSAARLSAARELKARAEKAIKRMVRRGKLKAGVTIDEDALNAIKAINRHFGISNTIPRWGRGPNDPTTPYAVIENMIRREADLKYFKTDAERTAWINEELLNATSKFSEWIRKDGASGATSALLLSSNEDMGNKARQANGFLEPFRSLSLEHLEDVDAVVAYLYGKSRDLMENVKGTFASEREEKVEAITEGFNERGKNYNASEDKTFFEKIGGMIRSGIHQNKSLVFLSHFVDRFKEFYSDEIGPFRKNFELQISYGESVMMHLQMKYEGMCKPHLLALMNSCKDRKLSAPIKNETTRQFGYGFHSGVLDGKEMAFVLLNAGAKENRQRLLESFGWTEEELNGILQMFTEEDYKHAEAIWSALQEMGTKMSEVYFKERHTRMKWVENTKIELKNNEGKLIVSEGGYYPLAYKYRFSAVNDDFDIINQPGNPKGPSEPSSVKTRAQNLRDICIYMSPFVLTKAIRDNARYIGLWEPLRMANAIWTDKRFRESMVKNYGEETYNVLRKLMDRVNNPDRDAKYGPLLNGMGAIMSTVALGFKLTTTVKQLASMYVGIDRLAERANINTGNGKFFRDEEDDLYAEDGKRVSFAWKSRGGRVVYTATDAPETGGALFSDNTLTTQIANENVTKYSNRGFGKGYFADAFIQFMQNPVKFRRDASEDSPFLRDRYNLMDRDLSIVDSEFKNPVLKVRDKYRKLAYWSMKQLDLCVAAVQWRAAYNYAINSDQFTEKEAMAYADDFVASSQGGARDIDIPAIQLDTFGRAITPFFGPACAAFNTKFGGLSVIGKMTPSRATSFFVYSFLFNAVACAYIQSLTKGNLFSDDDDDEDKARKAFWKALLSETVSGVPIIQDLADTAADMAIEGRPPRKSDILSVGMLRTANEIIGDFLTAIYNAFIGDYDYALYLGTSMASEAYGVPFVKVWEYYEKWWYNLFGDRYSETIKQKVKGE